MVKNKASVAKPPEWGSFPLDHFAECRHTIEEYMKCLKENDYVGPNCRKEVKSYMQCRMDKGLMAKEPMENLGLPDEKMDPRLLAERKKSIEVIEHSPMGSEWMVARAERHRILQLQLDPPSEPSTASVTTSALPGTSSGSTKASP
eukprot:TRINITY_DN5066_c0_g1_i1.p1 TRINITY_DN5066_c0_g1~~TRINITY_DN5066_c0_g1_i1.p1  ORF type:complete len:158 (+),score=12.19 TRINITY_DN5066_c0_g1_i1:37-474(+)